MDYNRFSPDTMGPKDTIHGFRPEVAPNGQPTTYEAHQAAERSRAAELEATASFEDEHRELLSHEVGKYAANRVSS